MNVGVVGAGTMGVGIALVAAAAGADVLLADLSASMVTAGLSTVRKQLARRREKGQLSPHDEAAIAGRIGAATQLAELSRCELVIEAIIERLDAKRELFAELGLLVGADALLATNTSSLSVTAIAAAAPDPGRVFGMHFFNPAPILPLVEVVAALQSSASTTARGLEIAASWGKTPILVKDTPGFVVNRVARPFYLEALRILEEGIADEPTIDHAMRSCGFKMGPFELMDMIGIDINAAVTESIFHAFAFESRYRPSLLQLRLLRAGYLGRKSGRGFYHYGESAVRPAPASDERLHRAIAERIVTVLINEAADALFWRIASAEEIDRAVILGVSYPKGLLAWGDELGWTEVLRRMEALRSFYGEERYRPSPLVRRTAADGQRLRHPGGSPT